MSAAVETNTDRRLDRLAGFGGLAFAVIVAAENLILGSMSPPRGDASGGEIAAFIAENDSQLAGVFGMVPFALVALALFAGGIVPRLSRTSSEAAMWTRVGVFGLGLVAALFIGGMIPKIVLIANASDLAGQEGMVKMMWQLNEASLVATGLLLGITLVGLSRAARLGGLIPRWQEVFGFCAAGGFFVASVAIVPAVEGAAIGLLGFAAFAAWLIWLGLTGVRLLRSDT
jgi:hypothetical protein